jgi:hypothetical protein
MIKRLAVIENNVVTNVILWDDVEEFTSTEGIISVFDEQAGPGWLYGGGTLTPPPTEVSPEEPV